MTKNKTAIELQMFDRIAFRGEWRRVVGVAVNVHTLIVTVTLEHWGGIVDFPPTTLLEVLR